MTKTATPTTPVEWEEYVNGFDTPEKFAAAMKDGSFTESLNGYTNARNSTMSDLKAQVNDQVQITMAEFAKRNGIGGRQLNMLSAKQSGVARTDGLYNALAPGAKADGVFESFGQFFQDALQDQRYASRESVERFRNYSEANPADGGYLVPEEFRSEILSVGLEAALVRPKANVVPMASAKLKYPAIDFTTEVGEVYGGIVMYWLDEGQTIPDTSASFAAIELNLHKLGGLASVPNELVRDAPALTSWLRSNLPKAIAHFEDIGFMKGNGVKKPLGGLHPDNPALIVVGDESGQSTASITWINVLAMYARLLPESYATAEWVITPDAIPEVYTMALPVGTGGSAVMIGEGRGGERPTQTMLGIPLRVSRKAPAALGTQGDISLVDWSTYVIGDGMEARLDTSPHSSFRSDKTDFRIIERVDGQPQLLSPLTPENGGPTLSSYIQLETRSLD